jgi:uncharacterized membrane protein
MTLNITLLTEQAIYQSADFRLINPDTKHVITDESTKIVTLLYGHWQGFVSYAGVGGWQGKDTSEWILQWLSGRPSATFDEIAECIRDAGSEWLQQIERGWMRKAHSFILAGFDSGTPCIALISNCEDFVAVCSTQEQLTVAKREFDGKPSVTVTGWATAVPAFQRHRLKRIGRQTGDDSERIRNTLKEINRTAANSKTASGMISPNCSVFSFRAGGQGHGNLDAPINIRTLLMGMALPDLASPTQTPEAGKRSIGKVWMGTSGPQAVYQPCRPEIVDPTLVSEYQLRELTDEAYTSCQANDINAEGTILGHGGDTSNPGVTHVWTARLDGKLTACDFRGTPGGINQKGEIAASAHSPGRSIRAAQWMGSWVDLGCQTCASAARAVNADGLVVGWVSIDPVQATQPYHRPAAWWSGQLIVLDRFGCDWGLALDVNDDGIVLVYGRLNDQPRTILWDPLTQQHNLIDAPPGLWPTAINANGVVLGGSRDSNNQGNAWLARPGQGWERLGSEPDLKATAMNDRGDVVGHSALSGYWRPWLRRATGTMIWLPYFNHHNCYPTAISNSGVIVGLAVTDHGTHALAWTPGRGSS